MPKNFTAKYNIVFAALICVFWSILVSASAVKLKDRQEANKLLDRQRNILYAAGLISPEIVLSREDIVKKYNESIRAYVIELKTGEVNENIDANKYDQRFAANDAKQSEKAPPNPAKVNRIPANGVVYHVVEGAEVKSIVIPVHGMGLWSTCYGYLALDADTTTILGVAFYEHGETPGLGGEIQNPKWTALWKGRKALNDKFEPAFAVKKGGAGSIEADPYSVDGITGATLTSNGVTNLVRFWLGDSGYGRYLDKIRKGGR